VRTSDEAIFMLGRQPASLLIVDEAMSTVSESRLLEHIADCGHPPPVLVRLATADGVKLPGRAQAAETVTKPLDAHDVVLRVGTAMQRPELVGRLDRGRDQSAEHLDAARRMQIGLLPAQEQLDQLQTDCAIGIAGICRPGEGVGGDFWGAWPTGRGRLALALADFAGHGLSAALNTFRLHAILSEGTLPRGRPARMTALLNQRLHALLPRGHYATMVYALLDPAGRRIAWSSAGGPPPLFVAPQGSRDLDGRGLPLGVSGAARYRGTHAMLPDPGILCLFSDGLYESGAGSEDIPREEIAAALGPAADLAARGALAEAAREGTQALERLRDRHPCVDHSDDVMIVCVALGPPR